MDRVKLWESAEWKKEELLNISNICEDIATNEWGLKLYPNQMQIITYDQMLDCYASGS